MSTAITIQRVQIELQRVQTWLFAVPRLRAMVGANALLGPIRWGHSSSFGLGLFRPVQDLP